MVHLPKEINLSGSWELGLSEILYPNTWYNIDTNQCYIFYQRGALEFVAVLPADYYQQPQYIVRQILQEMRREYKALVSEGVLKQQIDFLFDLTYNPQTQLTTMSIQHKKEHLRPTVMVPRNRM